MKIKALKKSMCLLSYALEQLKNGTFKKLIVIPNNAELEDSMELGALPGDLSRKMLPYTNVLLDSLSMEELNDCLEEDKIEIIPMSVLRGRNIENSIIWVKTGP